MTASAPLRSTTPARWIEALVGAVVASANRRATLEHVLNPDQFPQAQPPEQGNVGFDDILRAAENGDLDDYPIGQTPAAKPHKHKHKDD